MMERFRGKTITFTFTDGALANKAIAHTFSDDGGVSFKPAGGEGQGTRAQDSAVEKLREDVWLVVYRGEGGDTVTSVLDFATNRVISIVSNEKNLAVHKGTFETARERAKDASDASDASEAIEAMNASDVAGLVTPIH